MDTQTGLYLGLFVMVFGSGLMTLFVVKAAEHQRRHASVPK